MKTLDHPAASDQVLHCYSPINFWTRQQAVKTSEVKEYEYLGQIFMKISLQKPIISSSLEFISYEVKILIFCKKNKKKNKNK